MSLKIVSRKSWGATPWQSGVNRVSISEKDCFLVHYHGGEPHDSRGVAVPRGVERIHLANGWSGVGYNFMVDQDGTVYEGRGWTGVGAQCPGYNRRGIGVYVAIGGDQRPTDEALRSVRALYDEHARRRGSAPRKMGHKDGYATSCPGPHLYAWVQSGMKSPGVGSPGTSAPSPSQPKPKPSKSDDLKIDGKPGPATVRKWQAVMGTTVDGKVSHQTHAIRRANPGLANRGATWEWDNTHRGSELIRAAQRVLARKGLYRARIDGLAGPAFWTALQRHLGLRLPANDRNISDPSATIRALQRRLNNGKF